MGSALLRSRDAKRTHCRKSCIIIGAGLAGLAAAHYLSRRRWSVIVFEAQERFGGRVLSHSFPGSRLVCELGAEWIGDNHPKIKGLCKTLKLKLVPHRYGFSFWSGSARAPAAMFRPGAWPFLPAADLRFKRFAKEFKCYSPAQQKALDLLDWWTHLKNNLGFTESDLLRRDQTDSTDFGESIRMTSAYVAATEYILSDPTDEMDFKVLGGNQRIVDALVSDVRLHGGKVYRDSKVLGVHQSRGAVKVDVENLPEGTKADYCICTVPASCLNRILWKPDLPPAQRRAADQLQYARIVKTAVLYNRRFWQKPGRSGFSTFTGRVSDFCFDSTLKQRGRQGILCSYAVGDKADDVAGEPDIKAVMEWITSDMIDVVAPNRLTTSDPWR